MFTLVVKMLYFSLLPTLVADHFSAISVWLILPVRGILASVQRLE